MNIEILLFDIQARLCAKQYKPFVPVNGFTLYDMNGAWQNLERVEHAREMQLKNELARYNKQLLSNYKEYQRFQVC